MVRTVQEKKVMERPCGVFKDRGYNVSGAARTMYINLGELQGN